MKKEQTKHVSSWEELTRFVSNINPNIKTIILSGYINELESDTVRIRTLIFETRPVERLIKKRDKRKK
jgi:hypothetical protein